jgi:hypothetical protein
MRIAADYTTRANYQENYRKSNRDAINAKKRAWRKSKKTNLAAGCDYPAERRNVMSDQKPTNPNPNPQPPPGK